MPKRKRIYGPKRRGKRRRASRKRRSRYRLSAMHAPSGVPTQNIVKMRYVVTVAGTTGGSMNTFIFRANSVFDPEAAVGGHQPMGYDTMVTLYDHYTVLGSKIKCYWGNADNANVAAGVMLEDNLTTPYTNFDEIMEAKKGSWRLLTHQRNAKMTQSKFSAKRFFQLKDVKDNTLRVGAQANTNPSEDAGYIAWCQPIDGSSGAIVHCLVVIDYIVLWSEPKELAQS